MTTHNSLTFLVLNPAGMPVTGQHNPTSPAVHPFLAADFSIRHADWREKVLAHPGGFDGARAVLGGFHYERGTLSLRTAYRSYTEGLALRDSLRHAREHDLFPLPHSATARPHAELSWGLSLTCYVLLPHNHVLCAQRDPNLISSPGRWVCCHTEIIEPSDIDTVNMSPLLQRLVTEELPALAGLGTQKFVGLGLRKNNFCWQLVGVVDLRLVEPQTLVTALLALQPDAETAAWSVYPLEPTESTIASNPYPEPLRRLTGDVPDDFDIAIFLNRAVPPC